LFDQVGTTGDAAGRHISGGDAAGAPGHHRGVENLLAQPGSGEMLGHQPECRIWSPPRAARPRTDRVHTALRLPVLAPQSLLGDAHSAVGDGACRALQHLAVGHELAHRGIGRWPRSLPARQPARSPRRGPAPLPVRPALRAPARNRPGPPRTSIPEQSVARSAPASRAQSTAPDHRSRHR